MRVAPLNFIVPCLALVLVIPPGQVEAGNVRWTMGDSLVTVCPGGDSVVAGHPSMLRVAVTYTNASGQARVGVPPESIWVTLEATGTGALQLHDATDAADGFQWKVAADDSTDGNGLARISLFGFAGCGDVYVRLYVAGVSQLTRTARVRSLDADIHDPVAYVDSLSACDWDYNGTVNAADRALLYAHVDHGHRNALHGTLVRRTNACGTCEPEATGVLGGSSVSWSPDGQYLAYTQFVGAAADCRVFVVPSDPAVGNVAAQRTTPPTGVHDYDPDWSPLGGEVAFDRGDSTISALSTSSGSIRLITHSDDNTFDHRGDVMPAISPDGQWVVFARKKVSTSNPPVGGPFELWKIPVAGTPGGASATQLTFVTSGSDFYPQWSPDGKWIVFDRIDSTGESRRTYVMRADSAGSERALLVPSGGMAVTPALSRDGEILIAGAGLGGASDAVLHVHTMTAGLPAQGTLTKTVSNYRMHQLTGATDTEEEAFPIMSPRLSPDGTRMLVRASPPNAPTERPQLWAARRNMSLPPRIDAVAATAVVDSAPVVEVIAYRGSANDFVVEASDPESDALTYRAYSLREDLGMSFSPSTQTLSWTPPDTVDLSHPYDVRLQVETVSGGIDYAIARIWVALGGGGGCPTLATYTGKGWRNENTILGRSKDGLYLVDTYKLRERPARVQDRYRVEIRENEQERTTLDQVRLLAVDHDPKLQAFVSEGTAWLGERRPAHRVRTASGEDVTRLLDGSGLFGGRPGDVLLVEMDDPARPGSGRQPGIFEGPCCEKDGPQPGSLKPTGPVTAAAIDAAILEGSGFAVEAVDGLGSWRGLRNIFPRENGDESLVEDAGQGLIRIAFKGRQHLTFVGKLTKTTKVVPQELSLVMARHSQHKNVIEAVAASGGKATIIDPGQTLSLEFAAPRVPEGMVRDLFLVSRGVYTAKLSDAAVRTGLPVRFALLQSNPNPTSGPVVMRFDVPQKARIKLEVFDLLGRRIRVLADREFEAGYQAVEWDLRNRLGSTVAPGVYLYRMAAPGFIDQKKMTLLP